MSAKAVPAVNCAGSRGDEQRSSMIFMQESRLWGAIRFSQGIRGIPREFAEFIAEGHDLAEEGIVEVTRAHQGGESPRHEQPE
mgnify:CR=1 FL=1